MHSGAVWRWHCSGLRPACGDSSIQKKHFSLSGKFAPVFVVVHSLTDLATSVDSVSAALAWLLPDGSHVGRMARHDMSWNEYVALQNARWQFSLHGRDGSERHAADANARRAATPATVKRLLQPSPRSERIPAHDRPWEREQLPPADARKNDPRNGLPLVVSTISNRRETTSRLFNDGIPGAPITYFSNSANNPNSEPEKRADP